MAKKRKRRATTKRRRRSMSEFPLSKRGKRKSTRRRKSRKGMLSEMISHEGLKKTGKAGISGLLGGGLSYAIDSLVGDKPGMRALVQGGVILLLGAGMDMPNIASGIAGGYGRSLTESMHKGMSEDNDYADEDSLEDNPDALDEAGNPMYLAEDGNFYYMEEFDLAEDGQYYLSETMQASLYPGYVNPNA